MPNRSRLGRSLCLPEDALTSSLVCKRGFLQNFWEEQLATEELCGKNVRVCVCVYSSLNGEGKTSRVTELMQIELAFISPCSILCGRYLHFPKASSSLPGPPANPEPRSRGKPYKIWGISLRMERGEPKPLGRGALSPGQQGWAGGGWRWGQQGALHTPAHIWGAFGCRVAWHHPNPMCWSPS